MKRRALSVLAFALLALTAEIVGRSLTYRIDVGRHVANPGYAHAAYYPLLLAAVKGGIALLLARLLWRVAKARAAELAARRVLAALGSRPRVRISLSARLWLVTFALTSALYLFQTDGPRMSHGRWPLVAPWLHSSALPVFAVLAVVVAVIWRAVQSWLAEYETYAERAVQRAQLLGGAGPPAAPHPAEATGSPRLLFGLAFESRPPPLAA
jgi:hypothetical protein